MGKLAGMIVAIFMMACTSPQNAEPEILPIPTVEAESALTEPDAYLVRINFVLFEEEISKSPNTTKAFHDALYTWTRSISIETAVFIEEPSDFPFMPFGPGMLSNRPGVIRVHIADIHAPPYNQPPLLLGFWSWLDNELVLDRVLLENNPDRAYMVALHELGHVFGLPHFANVRDTEANTGFYIIPENFDAKKLVMHPIASESNKNSKLTKLEIEIAQKKLLDLERLGRADCFQLTYQ
jgi:hypothetical protein